MNDQAIAPASTEPVAQREDPDYTQHRDSCAARHGAPYGIGDVVWTKIAGRVRKALIMRVGAAIVPNRKFFTPKYTAKLQSAREGEWSDLNRTIFPGEIKMGYKAVALEASI